MRSLIREGKDKQTNVIAKKTAGKASVKDGNTTKHGTEFVSAIDEIVLLEQGMALEWSGFWKPIG